MTTYLPSVVFACVAWWFTTGVILYLDGLPRRTFRWSLLGASVLLALALYGLALTGSLATVGGAYAAFACGMLVWAWQEIAFLMGFVTGPRRHACPPGCRGWRHFVHAIQAILYHELAIIVSGVAVVALTWGAENQVGTWTFLVLWAMRLSAKLNLFFDMRNLGEEFLPDHLQYLGSFFTRKPINPLLPLSLTAATLVAGALVQQALDPTASEFDVVAFTLLATLLVLGIVEHWFLVLPISVSALWQWGMRSHARARGKPDARGKNGSAFAAR